jgi:hypothetical protein
VPLGASLDETFLEELLEEADFIELFRLKSELKKLEVPGISKV